MVTQEKNMEILELFDLLQSINQTAELAGVDPRTVKRAVGARAVGLAPETTAIRETVTGSYLDKIDEWVDKSEGKIRADVVHDKLVTMGYSGSERTTRRVVAARKTTWRRANHRIYKPWIAEPGLWLQYDFGNGPCVAGIHVVLFCAWLAWSRFRVVLPLRDKTLPSVIGALDRTFRILGSLAPTYILTDNEKTVTDRHVAGIAIRNPAMVSAATYYGVTIATCVPYDPESKGGSEKTVGIAKADLVPTAYNLRENYESFEEIEVACAETTDHFNSRVHAVTKQIPAQALDVERPLLHSIPDAPYTASFGESRSVSWSATISFRNARYSVPDTLAGTRVWVRVAGTEVVIVAGEGSAAREVARHRLVHAGQASIVDDHYRHRGRGGPLHRVPKPKSEAERAFVSLGEGAKLYLLEAGDAGVRRIEAKMAEAIALTDVHGADAVDRALGIAAMVGRFDEGDISSIVAHASASLINASFPPSGHSLSRGTAMWAGFGAPQPSTTDSRQEGMEQ